MKTTADLILERNSFVIKYNNEIYDILPKLKKLIESHRKNGIFDNVSEIVIGKHILYDYDDSYDINSKILLHYQNQCISIDIKNEGIECTKCNGTGTDEYAQCPDCRGFGDDDDGNECKSCDGTGETDGDCEDCEGFGYYSEQWNYLQDEFNIDLPEIVHIKTIDLSQGELF